jgi:hypothetical protein
MRPLVPQLLLVAARTLPLAITLLFSAAQIMTNNTAAVATGGVDNSLPVCTHPWSAACVMKPVIRRSCCWRQSATASGENSAVFGGL